MNHHPYHFVFTPHPESSRDRLWIHYDPAQDNVYKLL